MWNYYGWVIINSMWVVMNLMRKDCESVAMNQICKTCDGNSHECNAQHNCNELHAQDMHLQSSSSVHDMQLRGTLNFPRLDVQDMQLRLSWIKCATQLCSLLCLRSHTNATRKTCTCNCHEVCATRSCVAHWLFHIYNLFTSHQWQPIFMMTITSNP